MNGTIAGTCHSGDDGNFEMAAPHAGNFTLVISEPGFETVQMPVMIAPNVTSASAGTVHVIAAPLRITLPIASVATSVRVNADSSEDLTAPDDNQDSAVLSATDLKALPIFDNDYAGAMSAFLDDSASGTGGSGLMVDGVEANRATVSASAVQEVRINQDPYSARYYWPGRGQMEIITKSAADKYHGQFNFLFRDSALNAQNALAPSKPYEQRRIYEGHITGPYLLRAQEQLSRHFQPRRRRPQLRRKCKRCSNPRKPKRRLPGQCAFADAGYGVQHPRCAPIRRPSLCIPPIQL